MHSACLALDVIHRREVLLAGAYPLGHGVPMMTKRSMGLFYRAAERAAEDRDGVVSRAILRELGISSDNVRRQVGAGRWRLHGRRTVAVHTGPLSDRARAWRAVWEVGERIAVVDGVSALQVAGLVGYEEWPIHLSVTHHLNTTPLPGVVIHKVAHRRESQILRGGLPRAKPAIAAIRAAHWAVSDRQAALIIAMTIQQRLSSAPDLMEAVRTGQGRTRRAFIRRIVADVLDGAQALGELDVAQMCRARGLPEPERQVVRQGPMGRVYLDVRWRECSLVLEIDGSGHTRGLAVMLDHLRANEVVIAGDRVLRIDLMGLRLAPERIFDQIERALLHHAA